MRAASGNTCNRTSWRPNGWAASPSLPLESACAVSDAPPCRPMASQLEMKLTPLRLDLHQQTFAQAARCHAHGIEVLHQLHCFREQLGSGTGRGCGSGVILTHKSR